MRLPVVLALAGRFKQGTFCCLMSVTVAAGSLRTCPTIRWSSLYLSPSFFYVSQFVHIASACRHWRQRHTTGMARSTSITPSTFLEPDDVTPLQHVQLHEFLTNISPRHTPFAKAAANPSARVRTSSTRNGLPLYKLSGTSIGPLLACFTCADGLGTGIICTCRDVRPAHHVSFLSVASFWCRYFFGVQCIIIPHLIG